MANKTTYNIYFIRHGESCSNYIINSIADHRPIDYDHKQNIGYAPRSTSTKSPELKESDILFQSPKPRKYIDQHIINIDSGKPDQLDTNNNNLFKNESNAVIEFQRQRRKFYKFGTSGFIHPNLSFVGMQQAILLGQQTNDIIAHADIVFSSCSLRTIMTALISMRGIPNQKIYIVPHIQEIAFSESQDTQNMPLDSVTMKRLVAFIKEWLCVGFFEYYDDLEFYTQLYELKNMLEKYNLKSKLYLLVVDILDGTNNQDRKRSRQIQMIKDLIMYDWDRFDQVISMQTDANDRIIQYFAMLKDNQKRIRYLQGPVVDFTILEEYEKNGYKPVSGSPTEFNKFYDQILFNNTYIKNKPIHNIVCFTHGNALRQNILHRYNLILDETGTMNGEMWKETIIKDSLKAPSQYIRKVNKPEKIRSLYQNFERLNFDTCNYWADGLINMIDRIVNPSKYRNMTPDLININIGKYLAPNFVYEPYYDHVGNKQLLDDGLALAKVVDDNSLKKKPSLFDRQDFTELNNKINDTIDELNPYKQKYIKYKTKYLKLKNIEY